MWPYPDMERLEGKHVIVTRLNSDNDIDDLYALSHEKGEYKPLWKYMHYGPFSDKHSMHAWLLTLKDSRDPVFYSVTGKELR